MRGSKIKHDIDDYLCLDKNDDEEDEILNVCDVDFHLLSLFLFRQWETKKERL